METYAVSYAVFIVVHRNPTCHKTIPQQFRLIIISFLRNYVSNLITVLIAACSAHIVITVWHGDPNPLRWISLRVLFSLFKQQPITIIRYVKLFVLLSIMKI